VADHLIDARSQTGTAPDEKTEMRYPTRASELVDRRLQVPPSPLHDPSVPQLHASTRGEELSRALCLTWDIRGSQAVHPVPLPRSRIPAESAAPRHKERNGAVDDAPATPDTKASADFHIETTAGLQHLLPTLQE